MKKHEPELQAKLGIGVLEGIMNEDEIGYQ